MTFFKQFQKQFSRYHPFSSLITFFNRSLSGHFSSCWSANHLSPARFFVLTLALICFLVILIPTTLSASVGADSESAHIISFDGPVESVTIRDLNADGSDDLIVHYNRVDSLTQKITRVFSVLTGTENGLPELQLEKDLTAAEIVYDFTDLDRNDIQEMITLCADGVYKQAHTDDERVLLIETQAVLPAADLQRLAELRMAFDLDGDNIPELLIPQRDGIDVYTQFEGQFQHRRQLRILPVYSIEAHGAPAMTIQLPRIHFSDFNNDRQKDLVVLTGARADVFLMQSFSEPAPSDTPIQPDFTFDFAGRRMTRSNLEALAPVNSKVEAADLNNDGYVDFILTLASRAGFTSSLSQVHVYMNKGGQPGRVPDFVFTADNFNGEHIIDDFNGDGQLDFALFHFRIGYSMAARLLLTRKINHQYDFYLYHKDRGYDKAPDQKLTVSKSPLVRDISASLFGTFFTGDFNGDSRPDILTAINMQQWALHYADSISLYHKKNKSSINAPLTRWVRIADLNGDGADDCVLWYPGSGSRARSIRIIWGKRED